jgi:hypothetical protein
MKEKNFKLNTPVLFLVFNRLETTKKVFEEIKRAKPKQIFIAADGPRNEKEKLKTDAIRNYIMKNINWKCQIKTLFRDKNLGCKYAVSSAITWFFENVEQGIILEDDCLPSQSFFRFCQELLGEYKDDERVMQISGTNVEGISKVKEDYFFARTFNAWGWATWKRAWNGYDVEMNNWEKINKIKFIKSLGYNFLNILKTYRLFYLTYKRKINTWDYQWIFHCMLNGGVCIIPKKNLITNLGFTEGTHTTNYNKKNKALKKFVLEFPLKYYKNFFENKLYKKAYSKFFGKSLKLILNDFLDSMRNKMKFGVGKNF